MAILVVDEAVGMTAEQDAVLVKALDLEGSQPAGVTIRIAGPTADGWRIVSLWDSEADFERFRDDMLVPALASIGQTMGATNMIWPIETALIF